SDIDETGNRSINSPEGPRTIGSYKFPQTIHGIRFRLWQIAFLDLIELDFGLQLLILKLLVLALQYIVQRRNPFGDDTISPWNWSGSWSRDCAWCGCQRSLDYGCRHRNGSPACGDRSRRLNGAWRRDGRRRDRLWSYCWSLCCWR